MAVWVARKVNRRCKFKRRSKQVSIAAEEIYLRDDIRCGSPLCASCASSQLPHLPGDASHYLLPNAAAVLQFWEIFELAQVSGVIFLSSVLKEVQEKVNQRTWRRLRSIFTDQRRCNILFDDEHCIFTWLTRHEGAPDYLNAVAGWFASHLFGNISLVLVTGLKAADANSLVSNANFEVLHPTIYFQKYWSHDIAVTDLFTSLSATILETVQAESKAVDARIRPFGTGKGVFKEHLSASSLEAGISNGILRVGVFFVSRHAPSEAFVRPSNKGEASRLEIVVPGRALQNRALHGDTVVVKTCKLGFSEIENEHLVDENNLKEDVTHLSDDAVIAGEIVGVLQRVQRDYVACLAEEDEAFLSASRQERLLCIPMDSEEFVSRRDIRFSHRSCSIDPPGSKDVDDVLSVSDLQNGMVEVGVHIADVTYFVKEGSLLDLEAKSRGTTGWKELAHASFSIE